MSNEAWGLYQFARETAEGQCAVVAALIIALDEAGVMPKEMYIDAINRLWLDMPEETALGEAGGVIERMLDLLDTGANRPLHTTSGPKGRPASAIPAAAPASDVAA